MKKLFVILLSASSFISCGGGGKDASKLANDICECYKKANGMDAADPKRSVAQSDCVKKQGESYAKISSDNKKADEFNKIIGDCGKEMIQNSMPK